MSKLEEEKSLPLLEHLIELRTHIIRAMVGLVVCLVIVLPFSKQLYSIVAYPLIHALPVGGHMIATEVVSPFFVPLKVSIMVAFLISLPNTLYQFWAYIAPALYINERRIALPLVVSSVILFFIGMAFAYFVVFPAVFHFMTSVTPQGVSMATDINHYLSFVLGMFMAFGIAFELPVLVVVLYLIDILNMQKLKSLRPYVIVGAFVVAAIVTPPDILSQTLLAIPLILLYEIGLLVCRFSKPIVDKSTGE